MDVTPLPSRRFGKTLRWYVVWELVFPTVVTLGGLTAFFLTQELLGFSDLIINRGFGPGAVIQIAVYKTMPLLSHTLPFAVLIGVLVGLGRLRMDLEILSMEAAGLSSQRLVGPVLMFAGVWTSVGLLLALLAAPWATHSLDASLRWLAQKNPGILLRPGTVHEFGGSKIVVRETSPKGDQLRGILLWVQNRGQTLLDGQTIFAERGVLEPLESGEARLILYDGISLLPARGSNGGETRFETLWTTLTQNQAPKQSDEDVLTGMAVERLLALGWAHPEPDNLARLARIEFSQRVSYPFACLVFGLLAVSLALVGRRFSRATGGIIGLLVMVGYSGLIQLGDGLIQAELISVGLGVWLPNILVGTIATILLGKERWRLVWIWKKTQRGDAELPPHRSAAFSPRFRRYLLPRYVARHYVHMLLLSFGLLLVGYLLVDVLQRLQKFSRYHAEVLEVVRFYGARLPLLAARVIPMATLLATALTVSILAAHRELIGMRACGISAARALTPIFFIAALIATGSFLFNELVVPPTNALADRLKETEIKDRGVGASVLPMAIWYRAGTHVYHATQLDPALGEAQEISIYELGANGLPVSRTDALAARHLGKGLWELVDAVRIEISERGLRRAPGDRILQLGEAPTAINDIKSLSVQQLVREIENAEQNGYGATTYRVDLHVKLATPLACLLLPSVVLFFAVGGPPFPGPAQTILASIAIGVSYVLLTDVFASLGYGEFLPPGTAGWGASGCLATCAGVLALRHRG